MRYAILICLLLCACDKPTEQPSKPPPPPPKPAPAPPSDPPQTVTPRAPDFEDARGTVKMSGEAYLLMVEGEKPICLPFEAPAEARVDGARVRFTLYLSDGPHPRACRNVQTLISMRAE